MIRVLVPDMPNAEQLLPYLHLIDKSKVYSNGGALVGKLEERIGTIVEKPCAIVNNGTHAIELALRALNLPAGSNVLVPAITFKATGQAIRAAGLNPVLCDVSRNTWQLDPSSCTSFVEKFKIKAVVPVATFGYPVDSDKWSAFANRHQIPVLIDAAAALCSQKLPENPLVSATFSLHATKFIGAGEGGIITSFSGELIERVKSMSMFGPRGGNYKMSEYHAAVGLAALDRVEQKRERAREILRSYRDYLPGGCSIGPFLRNRSDLAIAVILMPKEVALKLQVDQPLGQEVETKLWYRPFLDELFEFHDAPRADLLVNTHELRARLLGVPFHSELTEKEVRKVCDTITDFIKGQ